jgi:hypothetical protein
LGLPVLPGFPSLVGEPHGGSATEATFARFPCIHAGPEHPVVRYNAASDPVKSMGKGRFPQFYWDFVPISLVFAENSLFLLVFGTQK